MTSPTTAELILQSFAPANGAADTNHFEFTFTDLPPPPLISSKGGANITGTVALFAQKLGLSALAGPEGQESVAIDAGCSNTTNTTEFGDGIFHSLDNGTNIYGKLHLRPSPARGRRCWWKRSPIRPRRTFLRNYIFVISSSATGPVSSGNYYSATFGSLGDGVLPSSSGTFTSMWPPKQDDLSCPRISRGTDGGSHPGTAGVIPNRPLRL